MRVFKRQHFEQRRFAGRRVLCLQELQLFAEHPGVRAKRPAVLRGIFGQSGKRVEVKVLAGKVGRAVGVEQQPDSVVKRRDEMNLAKSVGFSKIFNGLATPFSDENFYRCLLKTFWWEKKIC